MNPFALILGFALASERSSFPTLHSLVNLDPHSNSLSKLLHGALGLQASGHLFWCAEGALSCLLLGMKNQKKTENKYPTAATMLHK